MRISLGSLHAIVRLCPSAMMSALILPIPQRSAARISGSASDYCWEGEDVQPQGVVPVHIRPSRHYSIACNLSCPRYSRSVHRCVYPTRTAKINPLESAKLIAIQQSPTLSSSARHCFWFFVQMIHLVTAHLFGISTLSTWSLWTNKALELDERMTLTTVLYASPLMRLMPRKLVLSL